MAKANSETSAVSTSVTAYPAVETVLQSVFGAISSDIPGFARFLVERTKAAHKPKPQPGQDCVIAKILKNGDFGCRTATIIELVGAITNDPSLKEKVDAAASEDDDDEFKWVKLGHVVRYRIDSGGKMYTGIVTTHDAEEDDSDRQYFWLCNNQGVIEDVAHVDLDTIAPATQAQTEELIRALLTKAPLALLSYLKLYPAWEIG